jgi:hypothetical protein
MTAITHASLAVWSEATLLKVGRPAARPACAPSRVLQEHNGYRRSGTLWRFGAKRHYLRLGDPRRGRLARPSRVLQEHNGYRRSETLWRFGAKRHKQKSRFASDSFYALSFRLVHAAFMALFRSAQRFFIISEMRRLAAALKRLRPRLPRPGPRRARRDPRRAEIA